MVEIKQICKLSKWTSKLSRKKSEVKNKILQDFTKLSCTNKCLQIMRNVNIHSVANNKQYDGRNASAILLPLMAYFRLLV